VIKIIASNLNLRQEKDDYDSWNDCKEFIVKKCRESRIWYTAVSNKRFERLTDRLAILGIRKRDYFDQKIIFVISKLNLNSFKIRLKHGIYMIYINIEAVLKRAINIPEDITMQVDRISSLSLNAKGSNNSVIYDTAFSGDKLQLILCILRKTRVLIFTIYNRSINQIQL